MKATTSPQVVGLGCYHTMPGIGHYLEATEEEVDEKNVRAAKRKRWSDTIDDRNSLVSDQSSNAQA